MLLAALLPIASLKALAALLVCLLVLIARSDLPVQAWIRGLFRLKWLFISIVILYCWYTPGPSPSSPSIFPFPINMPSYLGIEISLQRSAVLAVLFGAVMLCLNPMKPEQVVVGLRWLLTPLALLGLPVDLFCSRLAGTLNSVSSLQDSLRANAPESGEVSVRAWVSSVSERGAMAISMVEGGALAATAPDTGGSIVGLEAAERARNSELLCVFTASALVVGLVFLI